MRNLWDFNIRAFEMKTSARKRIARAKEMGIPTGEIPRELLISRIKNRKSSDKVLELAPRSKIITRRLINQTVASSYIGA